MLSALAALFGSEEQARFSKDGYVILRRAIDHDLIDRFWAQVDRHVAETPDLTLARAGTLVKNRDQSDTAEPLRITDIEVHEPLAERVFLHPAISRFLKQRYGAAPTAIQTLTYRRSSEQGAHSDRHLVSPRTVGAGYDRDSLVASWVACEDADEDNGALILYPGSHTLEKKQLQRDFGGRYAEYRAYLESLCAEAGLAPEAFHAGKGDVLLWHGDFVHAGGRIRDPARTRRSLVTHYCRLDRSAASKHPERRRIFTPRGSYFG